MTSSSNDLNHGFYRAALTRIRSQTATGSVIVVWLPHTKRSFGRL
jgi:hypothetical protein